MEYEPFIRVGQRELDQLAKLLKGDLPHSSYVYNILLHHARKYVESIQFYTLKDYPDSHIVLWKHKENQMSVGIHCMESEVSLLEKCLRGSKVINFKKGICIFHVPDYFMQLLMDLGKEAVGKDMTKDSSDDFVFSENYQLLPLICPPGFKVCRLGKAGIDTMHGNWRYKECVPVEDIEKLAKNSAAVGVYEDKEQQEEYEVEISNIPTAEDDKVPVSWIGATLHGSLGMQMTKESFRRRGFAAMLTQVCAKLMTAKGFFAHVCIEKDLPELKKMYEKLPGWSYNRQATWIWQLIDEEKKQTE